MDWSAIIVAVVTGLLALCGTFYSNRKSAKETATLFEYRIGELEKKVDKHNQVIERTFKLEQQVADLEKRVS